MKKITKRIAVLLAALFIALVIIEPAITDAKVPYRTYTENGYGQIVETQTAYIPTNTIVKITTNVEGEEDIMLNGAEDIKVEGDRMYIADTLNARIIICDLQGNLIKIFGDDILSSPTGLFITEDYIYVADASYVARREGAVVLFDKEGNFVRTYEKPDDILYGANTRFQPEKLIVDSAGNMYIVSRGNSNGIVQISPTNGGTFLGYFGTNATEVSVMRMLLSVILTESQEASLLGNTPVGIGNVAIDSKGLIYTLTSASDVSNSIKKLNIAGTNLFEANFYPYGAEAIAVGQYDNIYVATVGGFLYEYTSEGSCLFIFGGKDNSEYRVGLFRTISSLDVDNDDRIYVLDSESNEIQVFEPTEFTDLIHESLVLYSKGNYTESKEPLEQVIRMNGLFDYANKAMAQALFNEADYDQAMEFYRQAKDKDGYSESFWEVRNVWLSKYVVWLIAAIVAFFVLKRFSAFADKKWSIYNPIRKATYKLRNTMIYKRIMFSKFYMRHPFDGAYGVRREGMCSYISAGFLTAVFILFYIIYKYFCGFVFKTVRDGRYNIPSDILLVIGLIVFASAVTYLVCTINDGEGRFREILCGYVYSLTPYLIIKPFLFILSMVLTNNEAFIMEFANIIVITWVIILIVLTVKEINNYSVKETFKVIGLTFFTAFVFILIAFVIYILAAQVVGFVTSIYGEVVYRIGN